MTLTYSFGENIARQVQYRSIFKEKSNEALRVDERQLDDTVLMIQISRGSEKALAELYDRYGRLVLSVAYQVVGHRETAEDITLETFNRVWEKAHTYQPDKSKVSTWLTRLGRNRAIDILRRENIRLDKDSLRWADVTTEPVTDSHNPEIITHLTMQQERVRQAVASLPETQREVLALAYFQGLSHSEIAQTLNQPLGTVKGRIRAAMKTLRQLLTTERPNY
ncbi:MAG: sigma-70 family RNA polymerase sigma factor [Chloroflexi bacterium]|nr:sigma-70 family RNA polymerase sigma factor [Chloroflexota bacterium]